MTFIASLLKIRELSQLQALQGLEVARPLRLDLIQGQSRLQQALKMHKIVVSISGELKMFAAPTTTTSSPPEGRPLTRGEAIKYRSETTDTSSGSGTSSGSSGSTSSGSTNNQGGSTTGG